MMNAQASPARRFVDEVTLRAAAVEVARFACNGAAGRVLGDPVFELVTEGRNRWKGYSACGDLGHYVLRELGFRDERILNRDDDGGRAPWQSGTNLSRLVFATGDAFVWAKRDLRPRPGDILYLAPPEHVCVLERLDEQHGRIATFDYGLWDNTVNKPAGRARETSFGVGAPRSGSEPACCAGGSIWRGSPDFWRGNAQFRERGRFSLLRLG